MARGGFDVIIGNPPYVELKEVKDYNLKGYSCESAGNLYAVVMERCFHISNPESQMGFIVPVSSISTDRYAPLQTLLKQRRLHYSAYDDRPSRLFEGLEHIRLSIHIIGAASGNTERFSTRYMKWSAVERDTLFNTLTYADSSQQLMDGSLPKLTSSLEDRLVHKLLKVNTKQSFYFGTDPESLVYYTRKTGYFLQFLNFIPSMKDGKGLTREPSELKSITFQNPVIAQLSLAILTSSLFHWYFTISSDCRNVNKREIESFPINLDALCQSCEGNRLKELTNDLMKDIQAHSVEKKMKYGKEVITVQCTLPRFSKPIIDEIDSVLAKHYGFTEEELDFIINYDIKYRMGKDGGEEAG
jgi:hypothetical protein